MRLRFLVLTTCALFFCALASKRTYAQNVPPARAIISDDFANSRPPARTEAVGSKTAPNRTRPSGANTAQAKNGAATRPPAYKLVHVEAPSYRRKKPAPSPGTTKPEASLLAEELGVTFWRLRPPRATDKGPKVAVKIDDNRREWWTPERTGAETQFQAGDRVRVTIESRRRGYLYVLNAEMYANGKLSKPFLIFPAPANQDSAGRVTTEQFNQVGAGLLVDIPDQAEDFPYFNIEPRSPDYVGELLLVIISPTPLEGLRLGPDQEIVNVDLVARLEETSGADAVLYMKESGGGEAFTPAEQKAQCGAKARQLVREKPRTQNPGPTPCGPAERRLTRDDPLPQSIYRVYIPQDGPLIVPVRIAVRSPGRT